MARRLGCRGGVAVLVAHVVGEAAGRPDLPCRTTDGVGVEVGDDHGVPTPHQQLGDAATDAACRTRDDRGRALARG